MAESWRGLCQLVGQLAVMKMNTNLHILCVTEPMKPKIMHVLYSTASQISF
jgi:hypothetical protein